MPLTKEARRPLGLFLVTAAAGAFLSACSETPAAPVTSAAVSELKKKYPEQIDLARARAACLTARGWAVRVADDATISASLTPGTEDAYNEADTACLKEVGVDVDAPPSEALLREAFSESIAGAACLRRGGWPVSRDPTWETFKDSYETEAWYPWGQVATVEVDSAFTECPPPGPKY